MSIKIYGSINSDTGETLETRSVQSPFIVPKVDALLEKENIGFWERFSRAAIPLPYTTTERDEMASGHGAGLKEPKQWVEGIKEAVSGPFKMVTVALVLVTLIVVVPRVLPVRS